MMGPRALLPLYGALFVATGLVLLPAVIVVPVVLGAAGGALAALTVCWRVLPEPVRPWVRDALRVRARSMVGR